jgi:hypothetical protein
VNADERKPDDWICPTCGTPVRGGATACPFCRTTIDGKVPPSFLAVAAGYIGAALLVCLGWTAFFALCGLVCALATGDWGFLGAITVFGLVAGVLFGIGSILIQAVAGRQEPGNEPPSHATHAATIGGHILGALVPVLKPLTLVFGALAWLVTKDARRQSPGRARRAMVGAIVLGLLGAGFLTFVYLLIGPPPPGGMTLWEAGVIVLIMMSIGAVLGLLSDSW